MDNSIYIVLSRQLALFRDMNVTANNVANVNTTGYGQEKMLFTNHLVDDGNNNKMAFAHDISTYRDTKEGPLNVTRNMLDFAISGKGYFAVETPTGTQYTRAGNFKIDPQGTLVTVEGFPVLDNAGARIQFDEAVRDIVVNAAGNISADGGEVGEIGVYQFENEQRMERLAGSFFRSEDAALPAEGARVVQGALEGSNVNSVREMTHMIETSRSVGSTAKFVESMYDLQRKTSSIYAKQGGS